MKIKLCRFLTLASLAFLIGLAIAPAASYAQLAVSVSFDLFAPPPVAVAPPPLPIYVVPPPPDQTWIWAPGYWRWGAYGYFWVPGTWVQAPVVGVLWTPGYWGWNEGSFLWHEGYWGPHVGFYGGVNYGGGYTGSGFTGGGWHGNVYNVNRSVTNVTNVTNNVTSISYNGGPGGNAARPTASEQAAAHEQHIQPTSEQTQHTQAASKNPALVASANNGKPSIAATAKPGDFTHNVVAAKQAGARNPAAEQHNAAVMKNPALAKGAALPRNSAPTINKEPDHPANIPKPQSAEPAARTGEKPPAPVHQPPSAPQSQIVHPPGQAGERPPVPAQPRVPAVGAPPREVVTPHPAMAPVNHPEGAAQPRKEPEEKAPEGEGEHRQEE